MEEQELLQLLKDAHGSIESLYDMASDVDDYFPIPKVWYRLEDAIKTLSEPCQCTDCPKCGSEHMVCPKCHQCTRCSKHVENCEGCTGILK